MTEYDFSPEAYEAYQKKIKGVGKWAVETSRFNGDFPSPFAPSPAETRRPLNKDNAAGSDSDSDLTSCSRRRRPVHPKSLTQWPGSRSRAPTPRQLQAPPPPLPPALGQRPPPVRSHTLPNQIYVPTPSPRIQQPQPQYPYPVQRPVVYNPPQQPVITQQQQQSKIYVPRIPKRTNTTPSKPLVSQYPHGVPVKSAGASPYATPVSSPYGSATYPSPRTPSKNWLSRMLGSLSIRGRSASPAPMYNSGRGPGNYESTTRHPRSKSLDPAGYRKGLGQLDPPDITGIPMIQIGNMGIDGTMTVVGIEREGGIDTTVGPGVTWATGEELVCD
ncbi:hypothetical protein D9758_011020 [Tetrapyrgos nigripes]|uniref:Uncharacterized protein n=1 Tax=Tetrapyrgos nigripes TaxID=182062 RepID=A0A8H5GHJ5_9AGAR|nr:hypothetical protein D9758_011020 [Tetrapyrgos nigripes]